MISKITVAYGDGIGPEIMVETLKILEMAGAELDIETIDIGEKVYLAGNSAGIHEEDWERIVRNGVFLKAPITTPQGGGYKSLNVTVRKTLGLYANVRPVKSLHPYVQTKHPEMDIVIIRENEEDLYAGIEHRQTEEVYQCLKLITRPGTEKIIRYAFEYARLMGRKKVTCMTKDNIMKFTDGLFHKIFDEISTEYPEIETNHWIIDIGTAKLANNPEEFDVIVLPNLYGDVLSDVAAEIAGSVGLAGSCNIGHSCAMFEAIHGSAPLIAGRNIANPSGLLLASVSMLNYLGQGRVASRIENAWLRAIEDGYHTPDIYNEKQSTKKCSTTEFSEAIIDRLGAMPSHFSPVDYSQVSNQISVSTTNKIPSVKTLDGIDVFVCENERDPNKLGSTLCKLSSKLNLNLLMITNRGVKVYPNGHPETFCTDHWRCRFTAKSDETTLSTDDILKLLSILNANHIAVIKTENLYSFDGERGYSLGQGQ